MRKIASKIMATCLIVSIIVPFNVQAQDTRIVVNGKDLAKYSADNATTNEKNWGNQVMLIDGSAYVRAKDFFSLANYDCLGYFTNFDYPQVNILEQSVESIEERLAYDKEGCEMVLENREMQSKIKAGTWFYNHVKSSLLTQYQIYYFYNGNPLDYKILSLNASYYYGTNYNTVIVTYKDGKVESKKELAANEIARNKGYLDQESIRVLSEFMDMDLTYDANTKTINVNTKKTEVK